MEEHLPKVIAQAAGAIILVVVLARWAAASRRLARWSRIAATVANVALALLAVAAMALAVAVAALYPADLLYAVGVTAIILGWAAVVLVVLVLGEELVARLQRRPEPRPSAARRAAAARPTIAREAPAG